MKSAYLPIMFAVFSSFFILETGGIRGEKKREGMYVDRFTLDQKRSHIPIHVHNDSLNIRLVGSLQTTGYAWDLHIEGDVLYMADGDRGLSVISIADPANPVELGSCVMGEGGHANDVTLEGEHAYLTDYYGGLSVISVVDPANPTELAYLDLPDESFGIAGDQDYVYIANDAAGLRTISISGERTPEVARVSSVFLLTSYPASLWPDQFDEGKW